MSTYNKRLTIRQVAGLLDRSTKSIRNYIKANLLKASKLSTSKGLEYFFEPRDVEAFAKKELGMTLTITASSLQAAQERVKKWLEQEQKEHVSEKKKEPKTDTELQVYNGEMVDFSRFTEILVRIENEKMKILQDFGEHKAQLAYKVGQLEMQVKLLDTAKHEKERLVKRVEELEQLYAVRDEDAKQLLKMKQFYESKPWWKFWNNKYRFQDSEKLAAHKKRKS